MIQGGAYAHPPCSFPQKYSPYDSRFLHSSPRGLNIVFVYIDTYSHIILLID